MKPKKELSLVDWKNIMKDPIFKNIRSLTISGGEAFLYENYFEIVKLYIKYMPRLSRLVLNTNGFFTHKILEDVNKISILCRSKKIKLSVSISIDGVGEHHDEIRRIPGGFNKAEKTLKSLLTLSKKNDFNVGVASLLMNKNIGNYNEMKSWLEARKINYSFQIIGFHDTYVNNLDEEKKLNFTDNKIFKVLKDLKKENHRFDFNAYYWSDIYEMYKNGKRRTTPCSFLKDSLVIDSLGDVYYCLSVSPIGNIIRDKMTVSEIYFDKNNLKHRKSLWNTDCMHCNSGCDTKMAIAYDLKKYLWFKITKKVWSK
jgi:MoaA/NifB/PqqE/SkfB family radical SAM enzyme